MKKVKEFLAFVFLFTCVGLIGFNIVSCEKQHFEKEDEIGTSQSPISFKFLNNNYKDCAINPVGLSPRLEWDIWDLNINYFRFCFSTDTIYWENCNITNCLGERVIPTTKKPLTQKYFLYQHQIPNNDKVTLEYFSNSFCVYDEMARWLKYPANEVTIRY